MSITNRLREIMEYKGFNTKTFAKLLDMPYRTLQNYLLNERSPSADVLIKVSNVLNVNLNWLMCGKGDMFNSSVNDDELSEKEKELISHYRMLPDDTQTAFDASFKFLSEKLK